MLEIREAHESDLDAIKFLLKELQEETESLQDIESIELSGIFGEMSNNSRVYAQYVAVERQTIIGFISMIFYKTLSHRGGTALINELIVSRKHRGSGVGSILIGKAVETARERGMDEIEAGTGLDNKLAQSFYRKNGFDHEYVLFGKIFNPDNHRPVA